MFTDPRWAGSWQALTARLEAGGVMRRWSSSEPELAGLGTVPLLLAAWDDRERCRPVGAALVRLAAADGGNDDDALLLLLHLCSGVVWRLCRQLGDLSPDIASVVIGELTCRIRTYPWRRRRGCLLRNLELDTRRAVLAELRPPDPVRLDPAEQESLGWVSATDRPGRPAAAAEPDLERLLAFAIGQGVDTASIQLLVESELARGRRGACADARIAEKYGMSRRTLLRHRARTLTALRLAAAAYLATAA